MDTLLKSEIRQEGTGASVTVEGLSKSALIKSLSPRVILSNHLLTKGTKMRVNLEDQSRQKVSFTFSQTKKPLQSSFFIHTSPETAVTELHSPSSQLSSDKEGKNMGRIKQKQTHLVSETNPETHSQSSISSSTRLKKSLANMHFKKQILCVSVTEEKPAPSGSEEPHTSEQLHASELNILPKSTAKIYIEFPGLEPQNVISPSERAHIQISEIKEVPSLKKSSISSGKDGDSSRSTNLENNVNKRKTRSQSSSVPLCSESYVDLAHTSSSHKSDDSKNRTNTDRIKEKSSSSNSHVGEREKKSSKRSENHERSSSYSKSERDSRNMSSRSSRTDRDRHRSRSRSRSRSRGSRTSSSHSRSERSRCDRGSRSERSYYHEFDRRLHKGSPSRKRRRSRSRTDRTWYSSDSEEDHRRLRTRTNVCNRSSNYSSSHKVSQSSSHSKSEKSMKSEDSSHSSELNKKMHSSTFERTSKHYSDSDSQHKCFPELDSSNRKSSGHHKSETSIISSASSNHSHSQTHNKHQKCTSSDSEGDHKAKLHASDKCANSLKKCGDSRGNSSWSNSKKPTSHKTSVRSPRHVTQSIDLARSAEKSPLGALGTELCSEDEQEKSELREGENEPSDVKEMVLSTDKRLQGFLSEARPRLELENKHTSSDSLKHGSSPENLHNVVSDLVSNNQPNVYLNAGILNSNKSDEKSIGVEDKKDVACLESPKPSLDFLDLPITQEVHQLTKPEESNITAMSQSDTTVPFPSELPCLETENQLSVDDDKKSISTTRKSRWDIVGQKICDGDGSNRSACAEMKPAVKKVVSIRKIEFPKNNNKQESYSEEIVHSGDATHSRLINEMETSEQKGCSHRMSFICTNEDQSKRSQASTHIYSELPASQQSNSDEPLQINEKFSHNTLAAEMQTHIRSDENKHRESTHSNRKSKITPATQDGSALLSDDSDNSAYDSDCEKALKLFHSVVAIPKHSFLIEASDLRDESTHSPVIISNQPNTHQVSSQKTQPTSRSGVCASPNSSALCQSQSNMIDSTSHSEGSGSRSAQLFVVSHVSETDSTHSPDNSRQYEDRLRLHEVGNNQAHLHYQHEHFPGFDGINDKNDFSQVQVFFQSEQPSSTCQQPDSSHELQVTNTNLTGAVSREQSGTKSYLHPHDREPFTEIHPDSLTNDYEDYSKNESSLNLNKRAAECCELHPTGSLSFVQAHEISSNSRGPAVSDPLQESNLRPHRGRGPPKKRRPEIESDSDNEAEAGPLGKRERHADAAVSKETVVKADGLQPSLSLQDFQDTNKWKELSKTKTMPPYFDLIEENLYLTERKKSKSHRDIKRMQCECPVLSREDRAKGMFACGEDCLNRLLMIECSSRCFNGLYCSNRRFQMKQHADFEVILTEDKGWGLRAAKDLPPNTFVLEYCGEVLDHKEFKTRVKEYARNKNIHYYFMALKNNEIIDATLKGNCSRFMNHSCEPNCETQKWTVNGQLRVGFFTTKTVTAGNELTFDYQFQRYGKEAQKCFCGAPSCRGFLGGENRVSVRAAGGKMKKDRNRKSALTTVDEELEVLLENGEGLYDEKQVVSLCRLMVRVETMEQKLICLKLIQDTQNQSSLKQFLDHHGLSLLWIFMGLSEGKGESTNNIKLQIEIMKTLAVLPISTKNMLEESKVLALIQRWAQTKTLPQQAEMDGYSSENTSRAQTPLNIPDGSSTKMAPELDSDTSKPAVYQRLKIVSENSLDSALSDASKASDEKEEEEDEEEEEDDDEKSHADFSERKRLKEAANRTKVSVEESVKEIVGEKLEKMETNSNDQQQLENMVSIDKNEFDVENKATEIKEDIRVAEAEEVEVLKFSCEEQDGVQRQSSQITPDETEMEEETSNHKIESSGQSSQTIAANGPAEQPSASAKTQEAEMHPPSSELHLGESTTEAAFSSETPKVAVVLEVKAMQVEASVIGTPSQDEEEGVSDVESERSQEPQLSALDISGMAGRLLESWKDLKEVYRIPKKSQVEKETRDLSRDRDTSMTPHHTSGSRDREREREKDRERDRDRDYDRDWDRERDRDRDRERDRDRVSDKTPRSSERRRRRSLSPPPSSYDRSSRRADERFDPSNSKMSRGAGGKERNKLSTEERRKLFELEVAQREAQKQIQLQQQLQTMVYDPALTYVSSPSFITYPPGYPIQTFVDPSNPNAGKVLLPTPPVEPTLTYDQTSPQRHISDLSVSSPSSTPQTTSVSNLSQHITTTDLISSTPQQYVQQAVAKQEAGLSVLSVPTQSAPQVHGQQSYTTLWDPSTQQAVAVQTQPAQQYATAPGPAQTQTAIYYQGQPCQTIYSIPAAYPQTSTPVIQAYTEPTASYLHGQPVYPGHQQGVVVQQGGTVTTIVTSQTLQQELIVPNNVIDLPPPSPPKPKTIVLPPNWKVARDPEGKIYYYHIVTRQTQWDPPNWDGSSEGTSVDHESEMDLGTPTYDENPSKFSTKTAEADTSSELAKKSKETFRKEMSQFIVQCLNPYRKPDCKSGRISNTEDFKHLARKLTHGVMNKELKACKNPEDLECNENVKHKTKEYIKKYMQRFGSMYKPKEDTEVY
uniref:[histone H3]-lysine(36) N-trimethyltransferase n=1 Tax=Nothobranchius furzeri TaxID=105023 RepID=A0A1A8ABR2_NOTFU